MPNVTNLINKSNTEKLNYKQHSEFLRCNFINKTACPLKGKFQYECIVYKFEVYNSGTELNEPIHAGAKSVCEKIGVPLKSTNKISKPGWEIRLETLIRNL